MGSVLFSAFFFILTLGILITFHEFGHFWVARKLGVKVLRFSVGFGRPLWRRVSGPDRTEYVIAALPFGGYVKMLDEREGEVPEEELPRAFNRQPLARRTAIVAAGPVFNFILAVAVYWLVFMLGIGGYKPIVESVAPDSLAAEGGFQSNDLILEVNGKPVKSWNSAVLALVDSALQGTVVAVKVRTEEGSEVERTLVMRSVSAQLDRGNLLETVGITPRRVKIPPVIDRLTPGGAAEAAGLQPGDVILTANGEPVHDWAAWVEIVRAHPEQALEVEVERDGRVLRLMLTPDAVQGDGAVIGRIGARVAPPPKALLEELTVIERYGVLESLIKAGKKTWEVSLLTLKMLQQMLLGDVSLSNLSGPISIAQYAGDSASIGLVPFLVFLAIVSISLGVLNLLPIPILDGGHLLYYLIEFIKGSPVSAEAEAMGQKIGIAVILLLMTVAFYNDLARVFR